jgi:hypothetical protein
VGYVVKKETEYGKQNQTFAPLLAHKFTKQKPGAQFGKCPMLGALAKFQSKVYAVEMSEKRSSGWSRRL